MMSMLMGIAANGLNPVHEPGMPELSGEPKKNTIRLNPVHEPGMPEPDPEMPRIEAVLS